VVTALAEQAQRLYSEVPAVLRGKSVIWHNPGNVEKIDFHYCTGGRSLEPRAPFTFLREDTAGTNPKVRVRDAAGHEWAVKFGLEASPDTFASCLAWAVGYYVEPTYYVAGGVFVGAHDLKRARHWIDADGHFRGGRFQLRSKNPEFLKDIDWSWSDNPFLGTHELNGLKVMMMLTSNWDDKDIRDAGDRGSNTAIFRLRRHYIFFVDDWGGAMGAWGHVYSRSKWNAVDYAGQTKHFVRGVRDGEIEWGYHGQHTTEMTRGIHVSDLQWLLLFLGRITDRQLDEGLRASGAIPAEIATYVPAIRQRIEQLQSLVDRAPSALLSRPVPHSAR
jgi:hypothetical protein